MKVKMLHGTNIVCCGWFGFLLGFLFVLLVGFVLVCFGLGFGFCFVFYIKRNLQSIKSRHS